MSKLSRKKRTRRIENSKPWLSPETLNGIIVIVLLALGGVSIFSLLGLAGPFGVFWQDILELLFGRGVWFFPAYLIALASLRIRSEMPRRGAVILGLTLMLLTIFALIDLFIPLEPELRVSFDGQGGGHVGLFLRYLLETVFGFWVAALVLVAVLLASILLTFDITLGTLSRTAIAVLTRPALFVADFFRGLFSRDNSIRGHSLTDEMMSDHGTSRLAGWAPAFTRRSDKVDSEDNKESETDKEGNEEESTEEVTSETTQSALPGTLGQHVDGERRRRLKPVAIDVPLTLLKSSSERPTVGDLKANRLLIQRALENFGISVEMAEVNVGPTVTQYTLKPEEGVKLSAIIALQNDLALALAAHPIRIEAPIPGRSLVGIEVPNHAVATVQLRELLESESFQKRRSNLSLALGKDVTGAPLVADLERMPHLLVAGATGSGKSVALNSVIVSLLYQNNPADLKFILVDPKRVEFSVYQHMPHLLTPVVTEVPATVNTLKWLLREMDRRFQLFSSSGDRNIQSYNRHSEEKLPFLILVIDELADLMVAAASEVEGAIIRLAQMSRAVGIHLVLATQRPSVDVITGLIKANITSRVAFSVASITDSRTILDTGGAEKLLGRGDLLYISADISKPKRLQGAHVGYDELREVTNFLKRKAAPEYAADVTEKVSGAGFGGYDNEQSDALYDEAESLVISSQKASASFLQRRLRVGYARAARLLDLLEAKGVIGPGDGAKPRDVLLRPDERDMLDTDDESETDEETNEGDVNENNL